MRAGETAWALDLTDPGTAHFLGAGWSGTEWAWTWTIDDQSLLILPPPPQEHDCRVMIRAAAHRPTNGGGQRLKLHVNGWHFGDRLVESSGFSVQSFDVSRHAYTNRIALSVLLGHPDAWSPNDHGVGDDRRLAFAVSEIRLQPLTPTYLEAEAALKTALAAPLASSLHLDGVAAPDDVELVSTFESLGTNCELGFVQRLAGAEPLGLLRLSGLSVPKLINGLEEDFNRVAAPGRHHLDLLPEGFVGRDDTYTMMYHTYRQPGQIAEGDLLKSEAERLSYLARKLANDLEDGEKIFVVKEDFGLHLDDVMRLHALVRGRGPGWVLWVETPETPEMVGHVEILAPGLMRGRIDRYADLNLGYTSVSQPVWLAMLRNAWALRQAWTRSDAASL